MFIVQIAWVFSDLFCCCCCCYILHNWILFWFLLLVAVGLSSLFQLVWCWFEYGWFVTSLCNPWWSNLNGIDFICLCLILVLCSEGVSKYGGNDKSLVWTGLKNYRKIINCFPSSTDFFFSEPIVLTKFQLAVFRFQLEQKSTNAVCVDLVGATQHTLDCLHQIGEDC